MISPSQTRDITEEISFLMPIIMRKILFLFLQKTKVSHAQLFTLLAIYHSQGKETITQLSKDLNVSVPTTTRLIDRLARDKYVKRVSSQEDRRTVYVVFTQKGKTLVEKLRTTVINGWDKILSQLPENDRINYLRILRKVRGVLS